MNKYLVVLAFALLSVHMIQQDARIDYLEECLVRQDVTNNSIMDAVNNDSKLERTKACILK